MALGYFVIAILGCSDGGNACTPVTILDTHYATEAECTAATGAALIKNSDFDFPTVVASCRAASPNAADAAQQGREKRRRG